MGKHFSQTIAFLFLIAVLASQAHAQFEFLFQSESTSESEIGVTYENPTVDGYGLDHCREWGENCGLPAATAFCQSRGHIEALAFELTENNQKTRVIGTNQVCDEEKCDRISKVICKSNKVTIKDPKVDRYHLDHCREWNENCGLPAANAFCMSAGYARAGDFDIVERNQKTRVINGGQVCDGENCNRISKVVCER